MVDKNIFLDEFNDAFEIEHSSFEDKLQDFDFWDSMALLIVIALFDQKFFKRVSGADIRNCETVGDLYNLLH
jgi:acyl carrier protein